MEVFRTAVVLMVGSMGLSAETAAEQRLSVLQQVLAADEESTGHGEQRNRPEEFAKTPPADLERRGFPDTGTTAYRLAA